MPNLRKDLAKIIDAIENFPHHYEEYIAMEKHICKSIPFKEYFIISDLELSPRMQMITPYKSIKSSIGEPSCSTFLSNEEEEGTKSEESSNPSACSSILIFFVFPSRIFYVSNDHSTYSRVFTLSTFQSASLLSMGHKGRVRTRRATTNKNIANTKYINNYY